ncbi:hypothetical protein TNIN_146351 [Trichonephila inaurata madagascariensis]|uniref:Uncharacterized protein n=1 Tax=Trichonephila inaurata madagascariensis TaxID=2747483 RepID=A0A8X6IZ73_9ARAC|nr:hypothetical protein TNIN_146351 [Trichonephila inaurata madagascariensis]
MFENAIKEDLITALREMGKTVDSDLGILELKQKLLPCKAYLEDEEFVCDFLDTTMEEEKQECRLERKQELELARIEARRKTEDEARFKAKEETRLKVVEETRLKAGEQSRLKAEEEAKAVGGKAEE